MKNRKRGQPKKDYRPIPHKTFWLGFISLFIISVMFIASYIASPALTGNAAVQMISFMKEGSELHFEVRNVKGVKDVTITTLDNVKNGVIRFDETTPTFQGIIYSAFTVSSADEAKFGKIVFLLKIYQLDLQKLGIDSSDIMLYRNGNVLVMESREVIGDYAMYIATSPGMGEFVIGKAALPAVEEAVKEPVEEVILEEEKIPSPVEEVIKKSWWQRFLDFVRTIFS